MKKQPKNIGKGEKTYTWKQIKQVIEDVFAVEAHCDDWGVSVIYLPSVLRHTKVRLKNIKQFIK